MTPFIATPMASYMKRYAEKKMNANGQQNDENTQEQNQKPVVIDNKLNLLSLSNSNTFKSFNKLLNN